MGLGLKLAIAAGLYWYVKTKKPETYQAVASTVSEAAAGVKKMLPSRIPGGVAHGMKADEFDPESLKIGTEVEMEHTDDPNIAQEIAMDHLAEDSDYYSKLAMLGL